MLKIIAGNFKNQIIPTIKNINYRPSTGKIKEAIFSILSSNEFSDNKLFNEDIKVLDLFSGSGSLAFEAISRGVGFATLIDINLESLYIAKKFANSIGLQNRMNFVNINALILPKAKTQFNLIFIDPPYYQNIVSKIIDLLIKNNWLAENAVLVIESAKTDNYKIDKSLEIVRERLYGKSKLLVLRYSVIHKA